MSQSNGPRVSPGHTPKMGQRNMAYVMEATDASNHITSKDNGTTTIPSPATAELSATQTQPQAVPPAAPGTDIIGQIIGDFGIWQLRTVLIIFLCKVPASWFMACIIFTAPELYPGTEFECSDEGLTANQTVTPNQCYIEDTVQNSRTECTKFLYEFDFHSLIMEFDLVCLRDIFVAWTQYWHLFGVLVGGVVGTKMMLL